MNHIVKYKWINFEPFLFFINGSGLEKLSLFDTQLNMSFGKRRCTGFFSDGKYSICPSQAQVEGGYNCASCRIRDIFFLCMQCDGSECINQKRREACKEESYFVYLVSFGSLIKVGISNEFRFMERMIEQGADIAAKIARVKDGKTVREIETGIMKYLGIIDRITGPTKNNNLFSKPNESMKRLSACLTMLRESKFKEFLIEPEIYDLRKHYRLHNVPFPPSLMSIKDGSSLSGTVVAAKGNILVLNSAHNFYSVNAHELIGRTVTTGDTHGSTSRLQRNTLHNWASKGV